MAWPDYSGYSIDELTARKAELEQQARDVAAELDDVKNNLTRATKARDTKADLEAGGLSDMAAKLAEALDRLARIEGKVDAKPTADAAVRGGG